jgi:hypothetical protein
MRSLPFLAVIAGLLALPATASALPPFTTTAKTSSGGTRQAELYAPAIGCHSTFDRFVFRARVATPRYDVRYVSQIVQDGSGNPVSLLGNYRLRVLIQNARGHTSNGTTDLIPNVMTPLCPNLRQMKDAGDFEGVVTLGLGLRRRTGFRVFRLTNPTRVVIDVAT